MAVVVVAPPSEPLIDVASVRARLGIDASVADAVLEDAIAGALQLLDGPAGTLGRAVLPQTLEWRSRGWGQHRTAGWGWDDRAGLYGSPFCMHDHRERHSQAIALPIPPVIEVLQVTYVDPTGTTQTLDPSAYTVDIDGDDAFVQPAFGTGWPLARPMRDAVRIRYTAGYVDAEGDPAPPAGLVRAILMAARGLASVGGRDAYLRSEQVSGIGSVSYDTGSSGGAAAQAAIDVLLAPYRVHSL